MDQKIHKIVVGMLVGVVCLCFAKANAFTSSEVPEDIRVGILYGSKAADSVTLSSPGGMEIGVMEDGEFISMMEVEADENVFVSKGDSSYSVLVMSDSLDEEEIGSKNAYPYFKSLEEDGKSLVNINDATYRGNVEIRRFSDSDMTVINHLGMQEYLYGVVPREIGGNSAFEAVKAQAIVARTYAVKNYGKRQKWGFNVYPTVDDQAYGGYSWENRNSNRAVDETDGQVVVYNDELIGGYYFSTSGGYTENSENVWGGKVDYLKSVPDIYEPEIKGNTTWEVEYTKEEVEEKLKKYGIDVGEIIDLVPVSYTEAGRVLTLKVVGTEGTETIQREKTRTYLGLKSQWYTINDIAPQVAKVVEPDSAKNEKEETNKKEDDKVVSIQNKYITDKEKLTVSERLEKDEFKPLLKTVIQTILEYPENVIEQRATKSQTASKEEKTEEEEVVKKQMEYQASSKKDVFVFRGRGWGHAVGMSQNGAKGMAEEGFSAEEIIAWYYSGVEVIG